MWILFSLFYVFCSFHPFNTISRSKKELFSIIWNHTIFNFRLCCKCWIKLEIFHRRWYFPALCLHCLYHAPTQHKLWIASFFNLKNNKNIWTLFIHLFTIYTIYMTAPRVVRRSRGCCSYLSHLHCHPPPKSHSPHNITQSQTSCLKLFKRFSKDLLPSWILIHFHHCSRSWSVSEVHSTIC